MVYSHPKNWAEHTFPALAAIYPIPQRYFVPQRIREIHRPRLEAAHLWNLHPEDNESGQKPKFGEKPKKPKKDLKEESAKAFGREKVQPIHSIRLI